MSSAQDTQHVVVLMGAGASVAAGLPLAVTLRDQVIERMRADSSSYGEGQRLADILTVAAKLISANAHPYQRESNPDLECILTYPRSLQTGHTT